jgi:copper chaperone CopZ
MPILCKVRNTSMFRFTALILMKTFKILILLITSFTGTAAFAQQVSNAELQVTGLTCSMCAKATETSLKSLDFITAIKPDLNNNLFSITFKDGKKVNLDLVRKKVEEAGFSVGKLTATFHFQNVKVDQNGRASADGNVYQFVNTNQRVLNGPVKAVIIDKNYLSSAAFKKNMSALKLSSYATGTAEIAGRKTRVYHLSI